RTSESLCDSYHTLPALPVERVGCLALAFDGRLVRPGVVLGRPLLAHHARDGGRAPDLPALDRRLVSGHDEPPCPRPAPSTVRLADPSRLGSTTHGGRNDEPPPGRAGRGSGAPPVGLEPTTLRLTVECSAN